MADPVYDVIIIGGGLSGLISARRYLDAQPSARISILEKDTCLGGVFSSSRTYPGFYTQWPHGLAEFSDLAMPRPPEEDCIGDTYKAKYQTKYFEEYADAEMADGRTLRERMRFSVEVRSVEKVDGVWKISCLAGEEEVVFSANRLMIASGAYTRPNIPDFVGRESFLGPVIHTLDFGSRFSTVLDDMSIQHVTIVGAGKSAADMAYQCAKAGKEVTWMISEGGSGPGFFVPIDTPTPGYKNAAEAAQTRLMAKLQPTILHHDGFWVWLLHRTWCGILLVGYVFGIVDKLAHEAAKYHERKNERGFEKLEYSPGILWQNNTGGAVHHHDFWDVIEKHVTIQRADITQLGSKTAKLSNGIELACDALLLGTGWKMGLGFFSDDLRVLLGLPHDPALDSSEETKRWDLLLSDADKLVVKRLPMLANPPPHKRRKATSTPYRLHNRIVPLHDQSIVFINHVVAANQLFMAEAQAMWAVALFNGKVQLGPTEQMEQEVATWVAYCKRRYLSNGELGSFVMFDILTYVDKLMTEMGSKTYWKGWRKSVFDVVTTEDLGRAWKEYLSESI